MGKIIYKKQHKSEYINVTMMLSLQNVMKVRQAITQSSKNAFQKHSRKEKQIPCSFV